jgi:hypothetical protein
LFYDGSSCNTLFIVAHTKYHVNDFFAYETIYTTIPHQFSAERITGFQEEVRRWISFWRFSTGFCVEWTKFQVERKQADTGRRRVCPVGWEIKKLARRSEFEDAGSQEIGDGNSLRS